MQDNILEGLEGSSSLEIIGSASSAAEEPRELGFPFPNPSNDYDYSLSSGNGEAKIGAKGFYIYLNRNFTQRAFDLVLSREQYKEIRNEAKALLDKLGFKQYKNYAPLTHFQAHRNNKRGLISDLSLNGVSLLDVSLDRQDFKDIMEGKLEREPMYRTIGLTDSKRSLALQELWMFWINQMKSYGVSSSA